MIDEVGISHKASWKYGQKMDMGRWDTEAHNHSPFQAAAGASKFGLWCLGA